MDGVEGGWGDTGPSVQVSDGKTRRLICRIFCLFFVLFFFFKERSVEQKIGHSK